MKSRRGGSGTFGKIAWPLGVSISRGNSYGLRGNPPAFCALALGIRCDKARRWSLSAIVVLLVFALTTAALARQAWILERDYGFGSPAESVGAYSKDKSALRVGIAS
jgi:hypothetical protein